MAAMESTETPGSDMSEYLKKIRLDGENLLKEYKNHPEDLLENEAVNTLRTSFMERCEKILSDNSYLNKNIVDFIWRYGWYAVIDTFKSQRKKFNPPELNALQKFLRTGIDDYFESLGQRLPQVLSRALVYKGDLLRYEHKLIRTEDEVLRLAEECYKRAIVISPLSGSSYYKLACTYDTRNPHITLIFLLRAVSNGSSSAVAHIKKLNTKNLAPHFVDVVRLSQSVFSNEEDVQRALDEFKAFMDKCTTLSTPVLIQNIHILCLLTIVLEEGTEEKNDEILKTLVFVTSQYLNIFIPMLLTELNGTEILKNCRNCPSPFENDTFNLDDGYKHLGIEPRPTLYENVLFPIIPLILVLNEWIPYLSRWLSSIKMSVGSRMTCQGILHNFTEVLNCFIDILGYRVEENPKDYPRAVNWLCNDSISLKKHQAFGILIDCLKQSVDKDNHPLEFRIRFKCNLSIKEGNQQTDTSTRKFVKPDCLIVSQDSWTFNWPKLVFLMDQMKEVTALLNKNTSEMLEQKSQNMADYKECLSNMQRLEEEGRCLIYEDNLGSLAQIALMLSEKEGVRKTVVVVAESSEFVKDDLPKDVLISSANDLYFEYCESVGLNLRDIGVFPADQFQTKAVSMY